MLLLVLVFKFYTNNLGMVWIKKEQDWDFVCGGFWFLVFSYVCNSEKDASDFEGMIYVL